MNAFRLALLATALGTLPAAAQVTTVDEGSFSVTQNGRPIGREEFRISSTPGTSGPVYLATATAAYGDRRLSPALRTDTSGAPIAYQIDIRNGTDGPERLSGQVGRGRFSARIQTPRGEAAREYLVSDGALVLDDDIYHQYYFLARRAHDGSVPVVIPRRNVQVVMHVSTKGREAVTIGDRTIEATHLVLTEPGGATRDVFVDDAGRVLEVAIPAKGIVAMRDDPPR